MVLDPLSALGVAGNIVQFVDFSFKLVSKTNELYERGSLIQHQHLHRCAQQIRDFNTLLQSKLTQLQEDDADQLSSVVSDRSADKVEDQVAVLLRLALSHCHESATELLKATSKLVIPGSKSRWQSFRQALSSTMGERALDVTTQRVFQAQQNVVMFLLLYTSSPDMDNASVLRSSFSLEKNILSAVGRSTNSIRAQIEALRLDLEQIDTSKIESFTKTFHDDNSEVFDSVGFDVSLALPMAARQRFLKTLAFESINDRYDRITPAHRQTLQWVLEPNEQQQVAWDSFPIWLEALHPIGNIYWVTGKPGSGKSTLMRFLADSDRTSKFLSAWAISEPFQVLKCFFWNPGNVMQRSMEGLLRTLAHQALSNDNADYDIIPAISPLRWHNCMYGKTTDTVWSLSELATLLRDLITLLSKKMKLMLLVDGLDEFGTDRADRETLIDLFLDLRQSPNIKLCLSSRPWNEFKDCFGAFPHLKLENLTKQDMRDYVQAELGNSRALQEFASVAKAKIDDLQSQLVEKSDGVFLWLFLVTRRLRRAAQDGTQLRKLFEILDQIPPDLDEFFQQMLRRIPAQDRIQASRIFQIMIDGSSNPTLMDLSFTEEDAVSFALLEAIQTETKPEILSRTVALRRRLDSQCMDLLVCAPEARRGDDIWDATPVEYLHRTVKDFLETQTSQELLMSYTSVPLDVTWYECNAVLAQMIFRSKFIHDWSAATENEQYLQRGRFQRYLQRFWSQSNIDSHSAKQVFELAVDEIDPLLKKSFTGDILGLAPMLKRAKTAEQVCREYEKHQSFVDHKYLLMALIGGFDDYAVTYIADLEEDSDIWVYFSGTVATMAYRREVSSCGLLIRLLQKCHPFETAVYAEAEMQQFHDAIRKWEWISESSANVPLQESYSKVTNLLMQKTEGLSGTKWQLQDLFDCCEKLIRETSNSWITVSLIKDLQKARKTWKTVKECKTVQRVLETVQASLDSPGQKAHAPQPRMSPEQSSLNPSEANRIIPTRRPSSMQALSRKEGSWIKTVFRTKH